MLSRTFSVFKHKQQQHPIHCIYRSFSASSHLNERTALITGSTSGIGLCIAQSLASKGCKVVLNGFGDIPNVLEQVKSSALQSNYNDIHHIDADLSKKEDTIELVHKAVDILGANSLDIVVNNAGFQRISLIENIDDDTYLAMINIMLNAPFFITKTVLPYMRKNGYGRVINLASSHGLRASPYKGPYVIAKHGVVGLTKAVALEMALENNINWTANAICPGYVRTELATGQIHKKVELSGKTYEEEEYLLLSEKNPKAQWVEPKNIAAMVEFLCTDDATQINGATWSVDGGWTAR